LRLQNSSSDNGVMQVPQMRSDCDFYLDKGHQEELALWVAVELYLKTHSSLVSHSGKMPLVSHLLEIYSHVVGARWNSYACAAGEALEGKVARLAALPCHLIPPNTALLRQRPCHGTSASNTQGSPARRDVRAAAVLGAQSPWLSYRPTYCRTCPVARDFSARQRVQLLCPSFCFSRCSRTSSSSRILSALVHEVSKVCHIADLLN